MFVRNVWLVFKLRPSLEHVQLHNLHGSLYLYTTRYIYTDMYVRVLVPTLDRYSKEEDSESLVDSLFEEKVKAGLWRYHPEFPQKKD